MLAKLICKVPDDRPGFIQLYNVFWTFVTEKAEILDAVKKNIDAFKLFVWKPEKTLDMVNSAGIYRWPTGLPNHNTFDLCKQTNG